MVDKFQTKEGAQEALQSLNTHQERAPSVLKNSQGILSLEFEAILTPQLQVLRHQLNDETAWSIHWLPHVRLVTNLNGHWETEHGSVHDQKQRAVSEEAGRHAGQTSAAGGPQAWVGPDLTALQVTPLFTQTWYGITCLHRIPCLCCNNQWYVCCCCVDFNLLNSKFSFDLLPGKRAARRNNSQPKVFTFPHPLGPWQDDGAVET